MILPGTGRWQRAALTEGAIGQAQCAPASPLHHRFAAVRLPVPGRIV
jgi:hypothetical protein